MDINQQMLSGQNIYGQLYNALMHQNITILQVTNCNYYWYDTDNVQMYMPHSNILTLLEMSLCLLQVHNFYTS